MNKIRIVLLRAEYCNPSQTSLSTASCLRLSAAASPVILTPAIITNAINISPVIRK